MVNFGLCKVDQLLNQVWPVVGDRVFGIMAKLVNGPNADAPRYQCVKQDTISSCAKAVCVRKNNRQSTSHREQVV